MNNFFQSVILRFKNLKKISKTFPITTDHPSGNKVLVIAPHFDDEIIGCGGVLRKHAISGHRVEVVYLTDGFKGLPWAKNKTEAFKIRRAESLAASAIIGINNFHYLKEPEGKLKTNKAIVKKLKIIVNHLKPDLIYLPWFLDDNTDHIESNRLLYGVYQEMKFKAAICAYEIWTPLIPNLLVNITDAAINKRDALECFKTQLDQVNYIRMIDGLNRYRSSFFNNDGLAEAFIFLKPAEYFKLML